MAKRRHRKKRRDPSTPPVALSIAPEPPTLEEAFFVEPDPEVIAPAFDAALQRTRLFAVASTRSRFLPMVKIVITACAFLIFVGGFRSAIARSHRGEPSTIASTSDTRPASGSPPNPVNNADLEAARDPATSDPAIETDPIASLALSKKSQAKLEVGAVQTSIALGEDAVRLDPANAQAWLVLGAAYQQRGDIKNAWRCYHACVDHGEGQARAECAMMLQ